MARLFHCRPYCAATDPVRICGSDGPSTRTSDAMLAAVPANPDFPCSGRRARRAAARARVPVRAAPARRGKALAVRMRLRSLRRLAHEIRRALLPRRDPVHRVRSRDRLPVSVGRGARTTSASLRSPRWACSCWCSWSASSTSGRKGRSNGIRGTEQQRRAGARRIHDVGGCAHELGAHRLDVADDVRPRMLRRRDDARGRGALRPRPFRHRLPRRVRASPT